MNQKQMSWEIDAQRQFTYRIVESINCLSLDNLLLLSEGAATSRRLVLIESVIYDHYVEAITSYFDFHNIKCKIVPIVSGEANKNFVLFQKIADILDDFSINRRSEPLILIGGSVLTDVAGFVASTYRRGIPVIRIPTTLMGYIDGAVGIKTAINYNGQKNRIGTFAPTKLTILDKTFLQTLPDRHIRNGTGEIFKVAVSKDRSLFELLKSEGENAIKHRFQNKSDHILRKSINGLLDDLKSNLYETNLARVPDFGHTFSLKIEMQDEKLLHGEAVSIDICFSSVLAYFRDHLTFSELSDILSTARLLGLPTSHQLFDVKLLWDSILERKAHRGGKQNIVLPKGIGSAVIENDIRPEELTQAVNFIVNNELKKQPIFN